MDVPRVISTVFVFYSFICRFLPRGNFLLRNLRQTPGRHRPPRRRRLVFLRPAPRCPFLLCLCLQQLASERISQIRIAKLHNGAPSPRLFYSMLLQARFKNRSFRTMTRRQGLNFSQFLGWGAISPSAQSKLLPRDLKEQWRWELPTTDPRRKG